MTDHDPGLYARSFTDVYDQWYGDLDDPQVIVDALQARCPARAVVIELGSGSGRIAGHLRGGGFTVLGIDVSTKMLRASTSDEARIAADMITLPVGSAVADAVIVAWNTLCNLATPELQSRCIAEAARCLVPGGLFVIDTFVAAPANPGEDAIGVSTQPHPEDGDASTVIITERIHRGELGADLITGTHVEVGTPNPRSRPWQLCVLTPQAIDAAATEAGFVLVDRYRDWSAGTWHPTDFRQVAWYTRQP